MEASTKTNIASDCTIKIGGREETGAKAPDLLYFMEFEVVLTGEEIGIIRAALQLYADYYTRLGSQNFPANAIALRRRLLPGEVGDYDPGVEFTPISHQEMRHEYGFIATRKDIPKVSSLYENEEEDQEAVEDASATESNGEATDEWPDEIKEGLRILTEELRQRGWATVMRMNSMMRAQHTGTIVAKTSETAEQIIAYSMSESFCLMYGASMKIESKTRVRIRWE